MFSAHNVRPLILVTVPLLAILGLLMLYYDMFYVPTRERYFAERYLRALAVLGEQIEAAIEGRRLSLKTATDTDQVQERNIYKQIALIQSFPPDLETLPPPKQNPCDHAGRYDILVGRNHVESRQTTNAWPDLEAATKQSGIHRSSVELFFCFPFPSDRLDQHKHVPVLLADLLEPMIANSPLEDVDIFLTDQEGKVLFQRGAVGLRLARFPSDTTPPQKPDADSDAEKKTKPKKETEPLPAMKDLQRSAFISEAVFSEIKHKVFTQPIRLSLKDNVAPDPLTTETWVVGAFVASHRFTQETMVISLAVISVLPLLMLFALLSWPILKVWTMSAREQIRAVEVYALNVSIVTVTALATILLLDLYAYHSLTEDADAEMRAVSDKLQMSFADEVRNACYVLRAFIDTRTRQESPIPVQWSLEDRDRPFSERLLCSKILKGGECVRFHEKNGKSIGIGPELLDLLAGFYFEMIVLTNTDGYQREKWTVQETATPFINISGQNNFRDAVGERLLQFPPCQDTIAKQLWWHLVSEDTRGRLLRPPPKPCDFALNVSISSNTTKTLVVLSIPVSNHESQESKKEKAGVAMMLPDLISLVNPVLPPGTGFAVIENGGRVLFHSNDRRRLYENFYVETDNHRGLRSAVFARRADSMNVMYQGRLHRIYIHPIEHTPWSLVVFRDKELLRTLNVEVVTASVLLFVLYIASCVIVLALIGLFFIRDQGAWLWPKRDRPGLYVLSSGILGGLALRFLWTVFHGSSFHGSSAQTAEAMILCPLLGAVVFVVLCWIPKGILRYLFAKLQSPHVLEYSYVGFGFLVVIVVGIIPAIALYKHTFEHAVETFTRLRQVKLAEALGARTERVKDRYREVMVKDHNFVEDRLKEKLDLPIPESVFPVFHPYSGNPDAPTPDTCGTLSWESPGTALPFERLLRGLLPDACRELQPKSDCRSSATGQSDSAGGQTGMGERLTDLLCHVMRRHFTGFLPLFFPVYSQETTELREMIHEQACDGRWTWTPGPHRCATLELRDARLILDSGGSDSGVISIQAAVPELEKPRNWILWLIPVCALVGTFLGLRTLARRIFGLEVPQDDLPPGEAKEVAAGWFLLRPERTIVENLKHALPVIDFQGMRIPAECSELLTAVGSSAACIVLDHFENRLNNLAWNRAKLEIVEELILRGDNEVVVVSEIDPLSYFARRIKSAWDPANEDNYITTEEMDRWALVFSRLRKVRSDLPDRRALKGLEEVLRKECQWTARLRGIEDEIRQDPRWQGLNKEELIRHIGDLAEAHYQTLWSSCTDEERLELVHLGKEGFVNPKNWATIRRLMRRRLIKPDPALRIMNESFRRFVPSAEIPGRIVEWEQAEGTSTWHKVRNFLILLLVVSGVFVSLTQPDVLTNWTGFLAAIAGGAGALMQLFGLFGRAPSTRNS